MDQRIINLYDQFTHGGMNRRDFLDRLTGLAGSAAAGAALLPLLQNNWLELAQRAITAKSRILGYERENGRILPIVKSKASPGWRYTEPDGEVSYVNCLLTTLAKRSAIPVQVVAGQPPPDLKKLAESG